MSKVSSDRAPAALDGPIVVYQMGKVGSRSVYDSLCALRLGVKVYHIHLMNHLDEIEQGLRKAFKNPNMSIEAVEQGRALRREIQRDTDRPWCLISLVRDPVARNVSRFFQSLDEMDPQIRERCTAGQVDVDELAHTLVTRWERHSDSQWFDTQVKEVFGIDVYARPFNTEQGFDAYVEGRFRMIVIRLENLDACFEEAIRQFLGIPRARLRTRNRSDDKWYGRIYREFITRVTLPVDYVQEVYASKFARHFYTCEELNRSRDRWSKGRAAAASGDLNGPLTSAARPHWTWGGALFRVCRKAGSVLRQS
jgi:hypothetical protein